MIRDPVKHTEQRVSDNGRALVDSSIVNKSHIINHYCAECYALIINQQATAANDCIGYMKNTSTTDLVINKAILYSTTASIVTIKIGDTGTPSSTTVITPVNCNAGSGNDADGTFYKGAELDAGSALTGGSDLHYVRCKASEEGVAEFKSGIIIPKNKVATFYVNHNSSAVVLELWFDYHNKPLGCS
jgi:hypothetical protein